MRILGSNVSLLPRLLLMPILLVSLALLSNLVVARSSINTTHRTAELRIPVIEARITLAVVDFGGSALGRLAADKLATRLMQEDGFLVLDRDQVMAAARGAGYEGSINLSLKEARDLGAALGCDFIILGDAQTLRRSPSSGSVYFESYATVFIVSARSGRLVQWDRPSISGATAVVAEQSLLTKLSTGEAHRPYVASIHRAQEEERGERELKPADQNLPIIEEAPDDDQTAAAEGLRLPRPYRRLTPPYLETAARAEAEGTVDVLVDLDATGEVTKVEISRWAGFGLDESTMDTVRRLHFFPAMRNGVPIPIRVLLRYNFRKPPR
jgi:TonB family protein